MQEYVFRFCILLCFGSIIWSSCNENSRISGISPKISSSLVRYENEMMHINVADTSSSYESLHLKYPVFTDLFFNEIMSFSSEPAQKIKELNQLITDSSFVKLYETVEFQYEDFSSVKLEIDQVLENYLEVFPEITQVPNIYTFISGFVYQCFVFSDVDREGVGIGLDMFLGKDFPYKKIQPNNPSFSSYLSRTYNRDHIAMKVAEVLVEDKLPPPVKPDFLSLMIWGGKKLYLLDQILDFVPDTIVMEYSDSQLKWCRQNESKMWDYFFDQDLFYETDLDKFKKLISPAPYSPGMPKQAPGRTGNYMGWRIVDEFMKKNPNISTKDLIGLQDGQYILNKAKFKPRR